MVFWKDLLLHCPYCYPRWHKGRYYFNYDRFSSFNESKRNCAILLSRLSVYLSINFSTIGKFLITSEIMAAPLPLTPLYGKSGFGFYSKYYFLLYISSFLEFFLSEKKFSHYQNNTIVGTWICFIIYCP